MMLFPTISLAIIRLWNANVAGFRGAAHGEAIFVPEVWALERYFLRSDTVPLPLKALGVVVAVFPDLVIVGSSVHLPTQETNI